MTFAVLEEAVAAGTIGSYGLATWDGLRVAKDDPRHLSLATAVAAARDAAGSDEHHLAVIQLPFNIRDHQAVTLPTQKLGRRSKTSTSASSPLSKISRPASRTRAPSPAAMAMPLTRSAPRATWT